MNSYKKVLSQAFEHFRDQFEEVKEIEATKDTLFSTMKFAPFRGTEFWLILWNSDKPFSTDCGRLEIISPFKSSPNPWEGNNNYTIYCSIRTNIFPINSGPLEKQMMVQLMGDLLGSFDLNLPGTIQVLTLIRFVTESIRFSKIVPAVDLVKNCSRNSIENGHKEIRRKSLVKETVLV